MSVLTSHGYSETKNLLDANLVLLNTCAIRDKPERKIWSRMADFRRLKERALLDNRLATDQHGFVFAREIEYIPVAHLEATAALYVMSVFFMDHLYHNQVEDPHVVTYKDI